MPCSTHGAPRHKPGTSSPCHFGRPTGRRSGQPFALLLFPGSRTQGVFGGKAMDEEFETEARGAAVGINPMFGEWQQTFDLEPVSYANPGAARAAFKVAVRAQLRNRFVFVGGISITIVLYLDEQKMLETPSYGDIDNHAKQLLDTIKGSGGILIDDCQVQHLDISWIDVPYSARFEMAIKA